MGRKLQAVEVVSEAEAVRQRLPRVLVVLGELVGPAQEGLLALSVGVGLGVLAELLEEEVVDVVGACSKPDTDRSGYRHGHERGEVTLGGRAVAVERPRAQGRRRFAERTRRAFEQLMSRRLDELELAVLMLDGIELAGRTNVVALGITREGAKLPLGLWDGSTENAAVATALLSDLQERGLDTSAGVLVVVDGAKALRKAVRLVLGEATPVQRCIRHKERNVLEHLPERERPWVRRKLRSAWADDDHRQALATLEALARRVEASNPGAAASLCEGTAETLTISRFGVTGTLKRTLESTNPIESMIDCMRTTQRNVKR